MWLDNTYAGWFVVLICELFVITLCVYYSTKGKSLFYFHLKNNWRKYLIILILLFPIILYVFNFREYEWSTEPADWGTFGDYIGGVYSVVLTLALVYVTYMMNRKNDEVRECKRAIKEIYTMVLELDSGNIEVEHIHKIIRCSDANSLHLSSEIYNRLIKEMDYYICIASDRKNIDLKKEAQIKDILKKYYNGY